MADQAPPPSYDDVVKSNPPQEGFPQGAPYPPAGASYVPAGPSYPPASAPYPPASAPYPPAGYSTGMSPAQSAYPPPPVQVGQGTQPPTEGGFPQYTYSTVNAGPIAPGGGQHYQFPGNQVGNTTVTAYQQPIVVSSGNFQAGTMVPNYQTQRTKKNIFIGIFAFIFVFIIIIVIVNVFRI